MNISTVNSAAQGYSYTKRSEASHSSGRAAVQSKRDLFESSIPSPSAMDRGTAADTTLHMSRADFDKLVHASTYGEPEWEELGVDNEKRWVVINGQRFEVEHSPAEKAMRKRSQMTFLDHLEEAEEEVEKRDEKRIENRKNIVGVENNEVVSDLLRDLFGENYRSIFDQ